MAGFLANLGKVLFARRCQKTGPPEKRLQANSTRGLPQNFSYPGWIARLPDGRKPFITSVVCFGDKHCASVTNTVNRDKHCEPGQTL